MSKIILQQVFKFHRTVAIWIIATNLMVDGFAVTIGAVTTTIATVIWHNNSSGVVLGSVAMAARQVTEAIAMVHPIIFAVVHGDIISTSTSLHLIVKLKYAHKHYDDYQDYIYNMNTSFIHTTIPYTYNVDVFQNINVNTKALYSNMYTKPFCTYDNVNRPCSRNPSHHAKTVTQPNYFL